MKNIIAGALLAGSALLMSGCEQATEREYKYKLANGQTLTYVSYFEVHGSERMMKGRFSIPEEVLNKAYLTGRIDSINWIKQDPAEENLESITQVANGGVGSALISAEGGSAANSYQLNNRGLAIRITTSQERSTEKIVQVIDRNGYRAGALLDLLKEGDEIRVPLIRKEREGFDTDLLGILFGGEAAVEVYYPWEVQKVN